jgi:hypothetical protein
MSFMIYGSIANGRPTEKVAMMARAGIDLRLFTVQILITPPRGFLFLQIPCTAATPPHIQTTRPSPPLHCFRLLREVSIPHTLSQNHASGETHPQLRCFRMGRRPHLPQETIPVTQSTPPTFLTRPSHLRPLSRNRYLPFCVPSLTKKVPHSP